MLFLHQMTEPSIVEGSRNRTLSGLRGTKSAFTAFVPENLRRGCPHLAGTETLSLWQCVT
jgi:hypothetical protein